jgi:endonuclease/exonuclease/phosphatase (EEP) superfamily protein YafD
MSAIHVAPLYSGAHARPEGGAGNLRILQANVWQERGDPAALIRLVRETEPDVILLQEFTPEWAEALAPLAADYPAHYALPRYPGGAIEMGMYARGEVGESRVLAAAGVPAVLTSLRIAGREIALLNVHAAAPWSPGRAKRHHDQFEAMSEFIAAHETPVILSGDLNAGLWQRSYRRLVRRTGLVNARAGRGFIGTWPSFLPGPLRAALDHTLVSPEIEIMDFRTVGGIGSDHRPMLTDLRVPERVARGARR